MFKSKRKNDEFEPLGTRQALAFAGLWGLSYLLPMLGLSVVLTWFPETPFHLTASIVPYPLTLLILLLIQSLLHAALVERLLKKSMQGWIPASLMGIVISLLLLQQSLGRNMVWWNVPALLMPMAVIQGIWLWQCVKWSWLWPLLHVAGVLIYTQGFTRSPSDMPILYFVVYGLLMALLWTRPKETEKAKIGQAETDTATAAEAARAARLQDENEGAGEEEDFAPPRQRVQGEGAGGCGTKE